jgi:anti-sigma-K factor RskA
MAADDGDLSQIVYELNRAVAPVKAEVQSKASLDAVLGRVEIRTEAGSLQRSG